MTVTESATAVAVIEAGSVVQLAPVDAVLDLHGLAVGVGGGGHAGGVGGAVVGLNDVDGGEGDVLGDLGLGDVQGARGLGLQRVVGGHVVGAGHDLEVVAERAVVVAIPRWPESS